MKKILSDIQDGTFAKDWLAENQVGCPHFNAMRKNEADSHLRRLDPSSGSCIAGMIRISLSTTNHRYIIDTYKNEADVH